MSGRTEHLEYSETGASLLCHAPYLHLSVVSALSSSPSTAAAAATGSVVAIVAAAGAVERRATDGAGDERVQDADDHHRYDEEDDARRREKVLQVRGRRAVSYLSHLETRPRPIDRGKV